MTVWVTAHGVGQRQDLPLPLGLVMAGAAVVLVVSFVALAFLWRQPRLRGADAGLPLPEPVAETLDGEPLRIVLRGLGIAATAFTALAAIGGPNDALNPTAYVVYVLFWVGIVPLSLLVGPFWRLVNPLRAAHTGLAFVLRLDPEEGIRPLPARVGCYPAAAGIFAFTWLELVAPQRDSTVVLGTFFAAYAVLNVGAAVVFGRGWFERGDAFEAYSSLVGRLAVIGRRLDGRLVLRNPLDGLASLRPAPGLVLLIAALLGSTAFDSFSGTTYWLDLVQSAGPSRVLFGTLGLAGMIAVVGLSFGLGAPAAGKGSDGPPPGSVPGLFAHSIVPIVVGYVVAHYFSLFVFQSQRALVLLSDPLGNGADLLGTAGRQVDYRVVSTAVIAGVQVGAIVLGHVVAVVAAHDRAAQLFPPRAVARSQLPLLALMVVYTVGGLSLLFAA